MKGENKFLIVLLLVSYWWLQLRWLLLRWLSLGWLPLRCLLIGWLLLRWLLLTFSLFKTPLGETGCLDNSYPLLTGCLSIKFFHSSQRSQLSHLWLFTAYCAALVWHRERASYWSSSTSHPTFTWGGRGFP